MRAARCDDGASRVRIRRAHARAIERRATIARRRRRGTARARRDGARDRDVGEARRRERARRRPRAVRRRPGGAGGDARGAAAAREDEARRGGTREATPTSSRIEYVPQAPRAGRRVTWTSGDANDDDDGVDFFCVIL